MGCFFGCFRVKDENRPQPHLVSDAVSSKSREAYVSRNKLASLLLSEDKEGLPYKDITRHSLGTSLANVDGGDDGKELKNEAKFLKAWGTLPETPAEIRKASAKVKDPAPQDEDLNPSKFHSWHPATSITKLHLEEQPDQRLEKETGSLERKLSRNKYVHFQCEPDLEKDLVPSKRSPNPTPLKLTDEMQTPGTVFPANLENLTEGKTIRIRSEYVYSVMNPIDNFSQWKALKEEDSNTHQEIYLPDDYLDKNGNESSDCTSGTYPSTPGVMCKNENRAKDLKLDASLSRWLEPSSAKDDTTYSGRSHSTKTIDLDRPIIGAVAAHWNNDEPSNISPKWWDGNGIPNSTNKYKEDQKVSWHATPFEERLEKALSDESLVGPRKQFSKSPIDFDKNEESDTAVSKLQTATHPESVVSF